jgi:hypothetical protein
MPLSQPTLPEQVASQAQFLVNNLQHTDYTFIENIEVDRGIYDCDCNGFVGFVLERAAPDQYLMVPKELDQPRPRAFMYYDFFSSLSPEATSGWRQIDLLRHARRGDVIAWRVLQIEAGQNTGHVFFVAEPPAMVAFGTFAVRVYDSSDVLHFSDTRGNGPGQFPTGVGSGFINFTVDDSGLPTAFQFGPADPFIALPIAIARLEPLPPTR